MKKKNLIIIAVLLILGLSLVGILTVSKKEKEKVIEQVSTYFQDKEVVAASNDLISKQKASDDKIIEAMNAHYSFDNPCVLVNPYEISPLTALIIFETSEAKETEVFVNGVKVTTMESATKHAIPIYGLVSKTVNKVVLRQGNEEKELSIDLTSTRQNDLVVEVANPNATVGTEVYFMSAPMGASASAYDGSGKAIWALTKNYTMDMEFLKNGHILLSNDQESGILYTYNGFVEIDLLGKIYKDYSLENGYHHELVELKNGNIIVAGGNMQAGAPYSAAFVYEIDSSTGKIIDSFDIYDIFASIDKEFADSLSGANMINNSIYYDEDRHEMILSLRGINSIVSLDYSTKKVNWIFGEKDFYSDKFQPYLLNITDHSRVPHGQHTAYLTSEGYLSVFNNDYDALDTTDASLLHYANNYSSATVYKIDGKNISTVWDYSGEDKYFNYALGSFYYNPDKTKLINFGWTYRNSAYAPGVTIFDYMGNTYARTVELDANDNIIFNATIDEGVYRTVKHSLYEERTSHYQITNYQLVDNSPNSSLDTIKTNTIFTQLDQAEPNPYDFDLTKNSLTLNAGFLNSQVVDLYFVSENENSYVFHYKRANEAVSTRINLRLEGNYVVYLKVDDQFYDTGKVLSF